MRRSCTRSISRRVIRSASALALVVVAAVALGGASAGAGTSTPAPPSGAALAALAKPAARAPLASERIYFVMPDRYANGDPSNDRGGLTGIRGVTGFDPADSGWYHGGDLRGLTGGCTDPRRGLQRVKDLGFTAVWITPPYGQKAVQGSSAAYHGYWIRDFTGVDRHLGTEADFAAFVDCAHRLGLKVYLDVVVNHTADVILPTGGSSWLGPDERPYRDCRGRRFDPARYVTAARFPCMRAGTMPRAPLLLAGDRNAKKPAWLNDPLRYHNRGDVDFTSCSEICFEQGDFFGLDDLFTERRDVRNGLAGVYASWIRRYKVDGFRVDTARHVDRAFFRLWTPRIMRAARAAGVPDFQVFGEAFIGEAVELSAFVRDRGLPTVLDFPLQDALTRFAAGESGARGVAGRLDDDDYFALPSGVAHAPPTFLGNHDMGRAAQQVRSRSGGAGAPELLRRVLLAHDLLYLLRGAPVVFYGDEVGMMGSGGDRAARQDMFPTAVTDWRTEDRIGSPPIGNRSSFDVAGHPVGERLKVLGALRRDHPALATGGSAVRLAQRSVLAVSRFDPAARREYLAVVNAGEAAARVNVATGTPNAAWTALLGGASGVRSDARGRVVLTVPPLTSLLLQAGTALPAVRATRPRLVVAGDDLSDLWRVTANATGPVSVSFAVKRARGGWARLAADDSPPYRAFLDPAKYRRNERVHLVAVVRAQDGSTAVSRVVPLRVRR
jgi:glycosidase